MQRHGDVKVEGVVIGHTSHEEHQDEEQVVLEAYMSSLSPELRCQQEAFECHKGELGEGDEIAGARVMSVDEMLDVLVKRRGRCPGQNTHLTISSRKITLLQQPRNTPATARSGLFINTIMETRRQRIDWRELHSLTRQTPTAATH